jgi:hypothetical protein
MQRLRKRRMPISSGNTHGGRGAAGNPWSCRAVVVLVEVRASVVVLVDGRAAVADQEDFVSVEDGRFSAGLLAVAMALRTGRPP